MAISIFRRTHTVGMHVCTELCQYFKAPTRQVYMHVLRVVLSSFEKNSNWSPVVLKRTVINHLIFEKTETGHQNCVNCLIVQKFQHDMDNGLGNQNLSCTLFEKNPEIKIPNWLTVGIFFNFIIHQCGYDLGMHLW